MLQKFKSGDIIEVSWHDAATFTIGWAPIEEYEKHTVAPCRSVGYLIKVTKQEIVLISTMAQFGETDANMAIAIPRPWVLKITKLGSPRKPRSKRASK